MVGRTLRLPTLTLLPSVLVLLVLRLPSFFEGLWFDDEGIYAAVAKGLHDGKLLYVQTWDSKPPGIFLLYYLAGFLPWVQAMIVLHLLALLAGFATIMLVYLVARWLCFRTSAAVIATCFLAVFIGSCVFDGTSTQIELWFLPVMLAVLYLLLRGGPYLLIGALVALAFFIKPQAGFEASVIFALVEVWRAGCSGWRTVARESLAACAGAAALIAVALGTMLATHTLAAFWYATFTFNLGYTATDSLVHFPAGAVLDLRYVRLLLALGVAGLLLVLWRRRRMSFRAVLIVMLVNVELYCATLSGRAYNHYALQLAPGLSLLVGWVADLVQKRRPAVQLAICCIALLAAFWLIPSAVIGMNWQLSVYPRPNDYYLTFVREFVLGREHRWSWRDAGGITRVSAFAAHYNATYDSRRPYFLFTTKPWLYALLGPSYANTYMEWSDWYDVPHANQEERDHAAGAQLVILDAYEPNDNKARYEAVLNELQSRSGLTKVEQYGDFAIYINRPP
jgi:hypothetical protein